MLPTPPPIPSLTNLRTTLNFSPSQTPSTARGPLPLPPSLPASEPLLTPETPSLISNFLFFNISSCLLPPLLTTLPGFPFLLFPPPPALPPLCSLAPSLDPPLSISISAPVTAQPCRTAVTTRLGTRVVPAQYTSHSSPCKPNSNYSHSSFPAAP
ncbi:hypothetical protein DPEC_G00237000 [Dallia pectoralis]|uniref:Uncharacterized protein n=1 Tax=Dallia pectoralis TaxID=75939 RepID=A0ACC2FYH5_DALPE|nr:hypothetical protein DPEC_G00237000 [Dallia pectoralis]